MVGRPPRRPRSRGAGAARSFGILSTFPPTACGIATFSAALAAGLVAHGATVDVVRCGDAEDVEDPLVVASTGRRTGRSDRAPPSTRSNDADVAIVQHEYGIYGGRDGDDVLGVLDALVRAVDRRRPHRRPAPDAAPALRARARCATRPTPSS